MATRTGGIFTPSSAFPAGGGPRSEEPDTLRPPAASADRFEDETVSMLRAPTAAPAAPEETQRITAPLPPAPTAEQAPPQPHAARPALPQPGYGQAPIIRTKGESEPAPRSIAMSAPSGTPLTRPAGSRRWLVMLIAALVALVFVLAAILAWVLYTR